MVCDVCKAEMTSTTTEIEVSVNDRMVKALHVPAMVCPQCNKLVVEELTDRLVRKFAKHCQSDTLDYPEDVKVFGVGFGTAKP